MPISLRKRHATTSPLAHSHLDVRILDLVAEHALTHRFENRSDAPLEVVYSFPMPLDAAFMGLTATLAGQTHHADIQPRARAEQRYDDAIADGHAAVLLTTPEPGLLCVSLGNLLPGQHGQIVLRFATALRVDGVQARYSLPLVHRPRYGRWALQALETPQADFAAEHPLTAHIEVHGLLSHAAARCSSHGARFKQAADSLQLDIDAAMLDRDLVVGFQLDADLPPTVRMVRDGEHQLAVANVILPPRPGAPLPLDLCLLLDGSGSMAGDAIAQSRRALAVAVDGLADGDRLQVMRFGSEHIPWFRRPLALTPAVRASVRELADTVAADLGGTEMGAALEAAIAQLGQADPARARAVILVTDGAVQPAEIAQARRSAQAHDIRLFVVAVGSAAGTEVLAPLAADTGAMLERAIPGEPIDVCVARQLRRAREQHALELAPRWPEGAQPLAGEPAYPGDAITVAALLPATVRGELTLVVPALDVATTLPLPEATEAPALRALLGQRRHDAAEREAQAALALHYGLLTGDTAAVLVHAHADDERPDTMPRTVAVAPMLPAGMFALACQPAPRRPAHYLSESAGDTSYLDVPAFLRRSADPDDVIAAPSAASTPRPPAPALLHALYDALLAQLAQGRLDLEQAVSACVDADALRSWLASLQPLDTAALLLALQYALSRPAWNDDQEAAIARLSRSGTATDTVLLLAQLHDALDTATT